MTSLPLANLLDDDQPKRRVGAWVGNKLYADLFETRYPYWGTCPRVIRILLNALHQHLETNEPFDPNLTYHEREQHLVDVLSRVSFGSTPGRGHFNDGPGEVACAPGSGPRTPCLSTETHPDVAGGI
jgi:hypothetical protein